jgi:hypothetical protein
MSMKSSKIGHLLLFARKNMNAHGIKIIYLMVLLLSACTSQNPKSTATQMPEPTLIPPTSVANPTVAPSLLTKVTQAPGIDDDLPTSEPTETSIPPPSIAPTPTGIVINEESIIIERLTSVVPLELNLDPTAGLIAYQQDKQLWLNKADLSDNPNSIGMVKCAEQNKVICVLPRVHWSPDGSTFFYQTTEDGVHQLVISDLQGQQQGYRISQRPSRDPVWSPDGNKIVIFVKTNRPWGDHNNRDFSALDFGFIDEVWQIQKDTSGTWLAPQKLADLETPGIGCGGGGTSISDNLYDTQGGFALGLQAAQQIVWTSDGVIIYPLTCDYWQGYGRLNALTGQPMESYSGELRGLTLDSSGSRWYAVTGHNRDDDPANNRLVTGTVASTEYEVIDTAVPVEMVFVGSQSGRLYYTAREQMDQKDLSDQFQDIPPVSPYFNFYHTQLWTILPDGSNERLLWESDDHSYSRVSETMIGDILFVLVENDSDLYEAMASSVPEEEWLERLPRTHIMHLTPSSPDPKFWLEDARDLTVWYPQG